MSRKLTTEEFIEKARVIHKDKYDYSKVEYVKASAKVVIICPEHGEFCQTPNKHISGKQGCPECKKLKIAQKLAFTHKKQVTSILKVNPNVEVLGEITGDHKKVSCRCLICNHEWQPTPASLKQGEGCPKCARLKTSQYRTRSHEEWLKIIKDNNPDIEISGVIINGYTPVFCRCKLCNHEWRARPNNLKRGYGCPKCAGNMKLSHEEQVAAIMKINPDIKILGEIIDNKSPVLCKCIICQHEWFTTPSNLKRMEGCPKCADYGFLSHDCGKLYVMVDDLEAPTIMKVGVSVRVEERRKQILRSAQKAGVGISDLRVARTWEGSTEDILSLESAIHQIFSDYKVSFLTKFDGCNEFFYYRSEVFEEVEKLLTQA